MARFNYNGQKPSARTTVEIGIAVLACVFSLNTHASLVMEQGPPSEGTVLFQKQPASDIATNSSDEDDDQSHVLFDKPAVLPTRVKNLTCPAMSHPKGWAHALSWSIESQTLADWGWSSNRWCAGVSRMLETLTDPVNRLGRWSVCDGATLNGGSVNPSMQTLCSAPYRARDWVEMRPRMTVYSLGLWNRPEGSCPAAMVQVQALLGALSGSTLYVVVPLEGNCSIAEESLQANWTPTPNAEALRATVQQSWTGYMGRLPATWNVGWQPVTSTPLPSP